MKNTLEVLIPRKSVFDKSRRDVTLDLSDLAENKIDPTEFFSENYITEGMKQLYEAVFKRLEGKLDDGIFKLTQSMGGGKTHNMISMGLLAKFPDFREQVMGKIYSTSFKGSARVVSFSGRQNPEEGIWGDIAIQLGKREEFKKFFSAGLKAPGQGDWIGLLQGEPLVIILDELAPYFQNAATQSVGTGTLADVTTAALSNLLVAVGKKELSNVVLIISDLSASYERGSEQMQQAFSNFEKETKRSARNFTPVRQNTDELYHILRKRIFENEASEKVINEVAESYAKELERVNKMDLTNDSPQKLNAAIKESYPFHPGIRDLYARFKENPGFMQTRGLIRLMRTVVSNMYDPVNGWAAETQLIHAFDIDPNDADTNSELTGINDKLSNAIAHDVADKGNAAAEKLSDEFANTLPLKAARLIFMASLSNVSGGNKGLKNTEIAYLLAEPGSDLASLNSKVLPDLREHSWYLHADNSGNLLYKNVQNISAKVNSYRNSYNREAIKKEIVKMLEKLFTPNLRDCYQKVFILPAIDEIQIEKDKVSLIIYEPATSGNIHPKLQELYDNERLKNRMMFLTGDHQSMESIYEQAKGIKATQAALNDLIQDKVPGNDPQMEEANTLLENYQFKFYAAVQNIFTKLYYPTKRGITDATIQLKFESNKYDGESQIKKTLEEKRKFTAETNVDPFIRKIEAKLFGGSKTLPWKDILQNAAMMPDWDWHHPNALEDVKKEQIRKELWRTSGDWIVKGPFPPPPTRVEIKEISRDRETGTVELNVKPINGDTIYYNYGKGVSDTCPELDYHKTFSTDEMEIEFLCVDSKNSFETGEPVLWTNKITLQHKFIPQGGDTVLEIQVAPKTAEIRYSTDGSEPLTNGGIYETAFLVKPNQIIQAVGVKGIYNSEKLQIKAPAETGKLEIDKALPLRWKRSIRKGSTSESYKLITSLKKHNVKLVGLGIVSQNSGKWLQLSADSETIYPAEKAENFLKFIQENSVSDSEMILDIAEMKFASGQEFLDLIKDLKEDYKPEEIEQKQ